MTACPKHASRNLLPLVYDELRKYAASYLENEGFGRTLQPTALVHEAFLKVCDSRQAWKSRRHFVGAIANAMRQILVDEARKRLSQKRGGRYCRVGLESDLLAGSRGDDLHQWLHLNEALSRLETVAPRQAEVVRLRFFAGCTIAEVADLLRISSSTVDNYWAYAKAWLRVELSEDDFANAREAACGDD